MLNFLRCFYQVKKHEFRPTTKWLQGVTYQQLRNPNFVTANIKQTFDKTTKKMQAGLFQGKSENTRQQTCFSEKKSRRWVRPHTIIFNGRSDALGVNLRLKLAVRTMRTIKKKYGSLDNYILAASPKLMKSKMGQYLRRLMLEKLANPHFHPGYVLKSVQMPTNSKKSRIKALRLEQVTAKPYQRFDYAGKRIFDPDTFTRHEFQIYEKLRSSENPEDMLSHPLIKEIEAGLKEEEEELKEVREQVKQEHLRRKPFRRLVKQVYAKQDEYLAKMVKGELHEAELQIDKE